MNKIDIIRILDKISPITSGIGAFVGYQLVKLLPIPPISQWFIRIDYMMFYIYACVMAALLAYLACTCTHRKLWFYSPGALGGFIGALIGMIVGGLLFPLISELGCLTFPPIFATIFSYLIHKWYITRSKMLVFLSAGIAYTILFSPCFLYGMMMGMLSGFYFLIFGLIFVGIIWCAVGYGIIGIREKSAIRNLNTLGCFLFAGIPGVFILSAYYHNPVFLFAYGLIILSVGLLAIVMAVRRREFKFFPGALAITIASIIYLCIFHI